MTLLMRVCAPRVGAKGELSLGIGPLHASEGYFPELKEFQANGTYIKAVTGGCKIFAVQICSYGLYSAQRPFTSEGVQLMFPWVRDLNMPNKSHSFGR
jgi:hypothetical protein